MAAYYNEHDAKTAAWLRELIKAGLIADGEVDTRSIVDVPAGDVRGFTQCHFFAGIGGWSLALRLAGWPDDRPVWTGSCPCQPFSSAGAQAGGHDPRDLWPAWFELVKECLPPVVFGEQVESAIAHGWLDRLCDDLESEGYAVGAAGLPAASVGAFHIRQRLWFVADSIGVGCERREDTGRPAGEGEAERREGLPNAERRGDVGELADTVRADGEWRARSLPRAQAPSGCAGRADGRSPDGPEHGGEAGELGDTDHAGSQGRQLYGEGAGERPAGPSGVAGQLAESDRYGRQGHVHVDTAERGTDEGANVGHGSHAGRREVSFWSDAEWIPCRDGKARPAKRGIQPLVARLPGDVVPSGDPSESYANASTEARVMRLRGYGNSVVPPLTAEFISAYMDIKP